MVLKTLIQPKKAIMAYLKPRILQGIEWIFVKINDGWKIILKTIQELWAFCEILMFGLVNSTHQNQKS